MIDFILRDLLVGAWLTGLAGSWRIFRDVVLPVALASCPFEFAQHEGPI